MPEWKDTCNLPRTAFSMKANLQTAEPEAIARWDAMDLYGQLRQARRGARRYHAARRPALRQRRDPHRHVLNKVLKDFVVKSRNMAGFDAAYVPGWDCHGLPIELKVDRQLGPKKRQMSLADFRRACRAYAAKYVDIKRADFKRLGVLGTWDEPYLTMNSRTRRRSCARWAASSSRTWSTRARSRCTGACTAAPRWPKPRSSTSRTPRRRSTSSSR